MLNPDFGFLLPIEEPMMFAAFHGLKKDLRVFLCEKF